MTVDRNIHIAIIDACEFTLIGFESLVKNRINDNHNFNFVGFKTPDELQDHKQQFDVVIYDPLHSSNFIINTKADIEALRMRLPAAKIYIFSASVGVINISQADGMFNKHISLDDLTMLWEVIMNRLGTTGVHYEMNITVKRQNRSRLTCEEASVLRGYSSNLKTKQIARMLGCNIKLIYLYRKKAIEKLQAVRGSTFYHSIRCILN